MSAPSRSGSRRDLGVAATVLGDPPSRLLLGDDDHRQGEVDVGVQVQLDGILADHAQRTGRQPYFGARQR